MIFSGLFLLGLVDFQLCMMRCIGWRPPVIFLIIQREPGKIWFLGRIGVFDGVHSPGDPC